MMENIGGILSSNSITRYLKNEKIRGKNVMATLEKYYICSHNNILVSQEGLEPPTPCLEGMCSIQLSY